MLSPGDELFYTMFSKIVIIISYSLSNFIKKETLLTFYVKIIYYKNERVK